MNLSFIQVFETIAIVVAGTMVGTELAVAVFVHPCLSRLDDASHVRAVQPLAAVLGAVMPFWYPLTLVSTLIVAFVARPAGTSGHGGALAAAGLFAAMIVYSVLLPVPINNQVARFRPEALPANWRELRQRWDRLHAFRVAVLAAAFILLVTACVTPSAA